MKTSYGSVSWIVALDWYLTLKGEGERYLQHNGESLCLAIAFIAVLAVEVVFCYPSAHP